MKENKPNNFFQNKGPTKKDLAYFEAVKYWKRGDAINAEKWAIKAMRLGSQTLAPQLLEEIAQTTQSKSTAITLASYYWDKRNSTKAIYWATLAKEYGSTVLADKLLSEINAHLTALQIHDEIGRLSK